MSIAKGILILGERTDQNGLASITLELLGTGHRLADELGEEILLLLPGDISVKLSQEAINNGADKVLAINKSDLNSYQPDVYCSLVSQVCREYSPSILLMGQTDTGRDLAPRVAARLETGLSMDCLELKIDPASRLMVMTKPTFGGNALVDRICETKRPQMATVRQKSQAVAVSGPGRKGEVINFPFSFTPTGKEVRILERVKQKVEGIRLEDAEVVVTGGRGIGGLEGFEMLRQLARLLGGVVAGSRSACEEGWLPTSLQVGQTGKIVSPNLYLAIAVSGATQHLAGCLGSKNIVAINRDPEANIFRACRFGLVADYKEAVPILTNTLKELLEK